ncbi:MAG: MCE family protein, partial [Chloroflexi bacterium]
MGKRPSATLIGAFVVGAVTLAVTAIVTFGSGQFFRHTQRFVLYFSGSLNGLEKGAPVKFRGVPIGSVKEIRLRIPGQHEDETR